MCVPAKGAFGEATITFNSSNKIAFISYMLSFNEKMLEYLRGMDLIIIEVPQPNSLYASNVKSNIDNEEIKVDTYEEYEIFINKVPNIVNVACRLGENSITLCVPEGHSTTGVCDKNNSKPYCVKFVMDRTHDLSYMNLKSSLSMYGENVLYKNFFIKNVKYALNYNKNCIDNKKFYNHKLYYSKKNCMPKICTECYKSINYTFCVKDTCVKDTAPTFSGAVPSGTPKGCDIAKCKECYNVYITPKKYTICVKDHIAVDNWREYKYIEFYHKLYYISSLDSLSTCGNN